MRVTYYGCNRIPFFVGDVVRFTHPDQPQSDFVVGLSDAAGRVSLIPIDGYGECLMPPGEWLESLKKVRRAHRTETKRCDAAD